MVRREVDVTTHPAHGITASLYCMKLKLGRVIYETIDDSTALTPSHE